MFFTRQLEGIWSQPGSQEHLQLVSITLAGTNNNFINHKKYIFAMKINYRIRIILYSQNENVPVYQKYVFLSALKI